MIDGPGTIFVCDTCGQYFRPEEQGTFGDAWREARGLGWRSHKEPHGKWQHTCPECDEEAA